MVMKFVRDSVIRAPAAAVFAFHEEPDAFERLQPPWQKHRLIQPPTSLEVGTRVVLQVKLGPFWRTIEAEHVAYERGRMFADRMTRGPFRSWLHRHVVEPIDEQSCRLVDDIEYELPFGPIGRIAGGPFARRSLKRLFDHRHRVTREACETERSRPAVGSRA
jgi:ligand-binding SRPBCC domain-containing protein